MKKDLIGKKDVNANANCSYVVRMSGNLVIRMFKTKRMLQMHGKIASRHKKIMN